MAKIKSRKLLAGITLIAAGIIFVGIGVAIGGSVGGAVAASIAAA